MMSIKKIDLSIDAKQDQKLFQYVENLELLLEELRKRELPYELVEKLNEYIDQINAIQDNDRKRIRMLKKAPHHIISITEKEMKLVAKHYYRNMWLALGLSVFGMPLGIAFSMSIGNMAFIGVGMPIGMVIGMGLGVTMDKKAKSEGRQLEFEM